MGWWFSKGSILGGLKKNQKESVSREVQSQLLTRATKKQ